MSRAVEEKIVTTVNNGNNNTIKANGGITSIGKQINKKKFISYYITRNR